MSLPADTLAANADGPQLASRVGRAPRRPPSGRLSAVSYRLSAIGYCDEENLHTLQHFQSSVAQCPQQTKSQKLRQAERSLAVGQPQQGSQSAETLRCPGGARATPRSPRGRSPTAWAPHPRPTLPAPFVLGATQPLECNEAPGWHFGGGARMRSPRKCSSFAAHGRMLHLGEPQRGLRPTS